MRLYYLLEHFGVAVAAITGVLAARGKRIDLFGVVVLALVTAFGGGTIRDCTLGALPVFWAGDPRYILTAVIAAVVVFYGGRVQALPPAVLLVADAFALALFTMLGLVKALDAGLGPTIGVVMGMVTGVAGGILRDVLIHEIPLVFRPETYLYATAAFLGSLVYCGLEPLSLPPRSRLITGVVAVLVLRLAGIRWRLALPVFVPVAAAPASRESRSSVPP